MKKLRKILTEFISLHKKGILTLVVIIASGGMIFKGVMQKPQLEKYKAEIASLQEKILEEKERQDEIDDLSTKVNTDEYIEKIATEKLGLIKSNATIFYDISDDN